MTQDKHAPEEPQRPHLFIVKLAQMLNNQDNVRAIAWTQDGDGVLIHCKRTLQNQVLPEYFAKQKYESFLRHMNLFGFKRQPKNKTDDFEAIYKHPSFMRDHPQLIRQVQKLPKEVHEDPPQKDDRVSPFLPEPAVAVENDSRRSSVCPPSSRTSSTCLGNFSTAPASTTVWTETAAITVPSESPSVPSTEIDVLKVSEPVFPCLGLGLELVMSKQAVECLELTANRYQAEVDQQNPLLLLLNQMLESMIAPDDEKLGGGGIDSQDDVISLHSGVEMKQTASKCHFQLILPSDQESTPTECKKQLDQFELDRCFL